jgi:hypothetical protein
MLRQFLIYLGLSIIVVLFARYAQLIIFYIDQFFIFINLKLTPIFSQTGVGLVIRKVIVLMLIPIIVAAVPALGYKLIKGKDMPHFLALTWVIWSVIVISDILVR